MVLLAAPELALAEPIAAIVGIVASPFTAAAAVVVLARAAAFV